MVAFFEQQLKKFCDQYVDDSFPLHSRIHFMKGVGVYVKREDELGFGISGSKIRKYASLIPVLRRCKKDVALVGSMYSNHVLSLLQLLKQENISLELFLQKPFSLEKLKGNSFFLSLLIGKKDPIWIEKLPSFLSEDWKKDWEQSLKKSFFWIPIGGCMEEALPGGLTLSLDILANEKTLEFEFEHIFIDAGTGMNAIGLILGLSYLRKKTQVHVVLIAGTEEEFREKLSTFHEYLQNLIQDSFCLIQFRCIFPSTAKSFGSQNATVFEEIKKIAEEEGIFLDPIYTAKSLLTTKDSIKRHYFGEKVLWIHSGGALSLAGFQHLFVS